jgi:hypothetical protein
MMKRARRTKRMDEKALRMIRQDLKIHLPKKMSRKKRRNRMKALRNWMRVRRPKNILRTIRRFVRTALLEWPVSRLLDRDRPL